MISAVILAKNEEKNIENCIRSVSFCDEVIIIDDNSEDRTIDEIQNSILRLRSGQKIKIYQRTLNGDFSEQRNFGLSKAKGDWVLFVDADERVSEALASEVTNYKLQVTSYDGFYIKRKDFMWGKELRYGEIGDIWLLRLARKCSGKWEGKVHEEWKIKGKVSKLNNPLYHYPHQSIGEFLKEINFYTDLRAKELYLKRVKSGFFKILFYTKGKFILNYFIKMGFLDGIRGLIFALMMSFHSFLTRGKLWQLWQNRKQ